MGGCSGAQDASRLEPYLYFFSYTCLRVALVAFLMYPVQKIRISLSTTYCIYILNLLNKIWHDENSDKRWKDVYLIPHNYRQLSTIVVNCVAVAINSTQVSTIVDNLFKTNNCRQLSDLVFSDARSQLFISDDSAILCFTSGDSTTYASHLVILLPYASPLVILLPYASPLVILLPMLHLW